MSSDFNFYRYVGNSPVSFRDTIGLKIISNGSNQEKILLNQRINEMKNSSDSLYVQLTNSSTYSMYGGTAYKLPKVLAHGYDDMIGLGRSENRARKIGNIYRNYK